MPNRRITDSLSPLQRKQSCSRALIGTQEAALPAAQGTLVINCSQQFPRRNRMAQSPPADRPRTFIRSLEGVRGYAFLVVFGAHYLSPFPFHRWWLFPVNFILETSAVSVPVFFVLSGFLICGILMNSRERQGYFKIFYIRRFLRVFPPYYLTLLGTLFYCLLKGYSVGHRFWTFFLYIHNIYPDCVTNLQLIPNSLVLHLWSMGVEEQFYLLWPLVVWICPNRRVLLRVTLSLIGCSCVLRFLFPLLRLDPFLMNAWTPTRVDGILLGSLLAIIRHDAIYRRLEPLAKYFALAGLIVSAWARAVRGDTVMDGSILTAFLIPVWNVTAAGIVVAVMRKGGLLNRICSTNGICWLGARSYSLYLFHFVYAGWVLGTLVPYLTGYMPHRLATIVAVAAAFAFTVFLASLCYRFIEQPTMDLKTRFKYGAARTAEIAPIVASMELVESK